MGKRCAQQETRFGHNMLAVKWWDCLKAVRHAPISRKDLAQVCGMSRQSVERWVREGIDQGFLIEVPAPRDAFDSYTGRWPVWVALSRSAKADVSAPRDAFDSRPGRGGSLISSTHAMKQRV